MKLETYGLENSQEVGASGGGYAGQYQTDDVGDHFEDDEPPRIVGLNACLLRLLRVGQDGFDLLFAEFNFHNARVLRVNGSVLGIELFPM